MTKPKNPKKTPAKKKQVPIFGPEWWEETKRGDGKKSTKGEENLYKNPIQEIVIKPDWWGSPAYDVRDFAIQLLTGYIWACKYGPQMHCKHPERSECETILYRLSHLKQKEVEGRWVPDEDSQLQLALIDFVRVLPEMWD